LGYSAIIDRLESEIRQYRVEYQRFFNGDATAPPDEEWAGIRKQLTKLTSVSQLSPVERFRLSGLEGRYNSLSELFRRRLREMTTARQAASMPRPLPTLGDTSAVVGADSGTDDVSSLFNALYADTGSSVALEDFHAYLVKKADTVRTQTGCKEVRFTVRSDGGKRTLKARPLQSDD
jgi:hypothetical protein